MTKYLIVILIILSSCVNKSTEQDFILEGHTDFPNEKIAVHQLNIDLISFDALDTIRTDDKGDFRLVMNIQEPGIAYIRLPNGLPADVFAEPGKQVRIDQKGKNLEYAENNKLHQLMKEVQRSYYKINREFSDENEITKYLDSLFLQQNRNLDTLKHSGSSAFYDYLK